MTGATSNEVEFRPLRNMAIKLPLSRHHRTGNRCWFLDRDTFEPIQSEAYVFDIEQMDAEALLEIIDRIPPKAQLPLEIRQSINASDTDVAQFDVNDLFSSLTEPGTRHKRMVRMAVFIRHYGVDERACRETLTSWYRAQSDCFINSSEKVILGEIRRIVRWVHSSDFHTAGTNNG